MDKEELDKSLKIILELEDAAYRRGFEEGTEKTVKRLSATIRSAEQETGLDISTIGKLRHAIKDLPDRIEVFDGSAGMPLRGEMASLYGEAKGLFVYGKRCRPQYLGEPF